MAAYKEQYYSLEEYEMQDLIDQAKKGNNHSQEELIKVFNNFLTKYTTMLYYGKYNLNDYDIRRFIALFIKDNYARMALVRNKMNKQSIAVVNETMRGINYMAKRYGDEEDIRQTVDMTFFQCIMRYQRKDSEKGPIPFSAFLYSYFFYLLKKNVDTFLIDQLGRKTFPLITDEEYEPEEGEQQVGFKADPVEYDLDALLSVEEIDEMWVLRRHGSISFQRVEHSRKATAKMEVC